jgi:hypothetical protein
VVDLKYGSIPVLVKNGNTVPDVNILHTNSSVAFLCKMVHLG